MHEVPVNRLGDLSLPRKSVVRLIDRPDMTLDVNRGRKTTMQQCNNKILHGRVHQYTNGLKGPPKKQTGSEVTKISMLNSAENEILNAHKYKDIKKFSFSQACSDKPRMLFFCS